MYLTPKLIFTSRVLGLKSWAYASVSQILKDLPLKFQGPSYRRGRKNPRKIHEQKDRKLNFLSFCGSHFGKRFIQFQDIAFQSSYSFYYELKSLFKV